MINVNDILARLQAGETPEAIADECAKAINGAIELNNKALEDQKKKEVKAKADARMNELAQTIADAVMEYIPLCDPEVGKMFGDDTLTAAEVREMFDTLIPSMKSLVELTKLCGGPVNPVVKTTSVKKVNNDDAIKNFLKQFVD